ncbi:MAG: glutathione S-transferase N-terminal domain-containing protein [Limnobacter sp.]|nr:glutathione S-transferase N-terminal domain-containing protein [Limnobacter sp.]
MKLKHWLKVGRATAASTARGWQGLFAGRVAMQPVLRLKLYEFEACPFCRLVREALTELGLDAEIYPCPKGGQRFRQEAVAIGGKEQFPLLVDPNTGLVLYESMQIIEYLYDQYAGRSLPWKYRAGPLQLISSAANGLLGGMDGMTAKPSVQPEKPLELSSFEASPFCRPVRETLCELEIPYILHNLGKEQWADMGAGGMHAAIGEYQPVKGGKREAFMKKTQKMMVPYLEDPNTGKALFESEAIITYLRQTYGQP